MGLFDKLKKVVVKGDDKPAPKAGKGSDTKAGVKSGGPRPYVPPAYKPKPAVNHGNGWSADEEYRLKSGYDRGTSIEDLSNIHGRTREAIAHRLIKLGYGNITTLKRHQARKV
jgi:hypothetical protein